MFLYVDESGSPSRKEPLDQPIYVVGCISVEDDAELTGVISEVRRSLRLPLDHEFHSYHEKVAFRLAFLTALMSIEDVTFTAHIIDKRRIVTPYGSLKAPALYRRAVAIGIDASLGSRHCHAVILDAFAGNKAEDHALRAYLRQHINKPERRVGEFQIRDSRTIDGLQAADMVAGAVAQYYSRGDEQFRSLILPRLQEVYWPENE